MTEENRSRNSDLVECGIDEYETVVEKKVETTKKKKK